MHTIDTPAVNIALGIDADTVRRTAVRVRECAAVDECKRALLDIILVAGRRVSLDLLHTLKRVRTWSREACHYSGTDRRTPRCPRCAKLRSVRLVKPMIMRVHISVLVVGGEREAIGLVDAVCHDADRACLGVEAVDLRRDLRLGLEVLVVAVPSDAVSDPAYGIRNDGTTHGTSVKNISPEGCTRTSLRELNCRPK